MERAARARTLPSRSVRVLTTSGCVFPVGGDETAITAAAAVTIARADHVPRPRMALATATVAEAATQIQP